MKGNYAEAFYQFYIALFATQDIDTLTVEFAPALVNNCGFIAQYFKDNELARKCYWFAIEYDNNCYKAMYRLGKDYKDQNNNKQAL